MAAENLYQRCWQCDEVIGLVGEWVGTLCAPALDVAFLCGRLDGTQVRHKVANGLQPDIVALPCATLDLGVDLGANKGATYCQYCG